MWIIKILVWLGLMLLLIFFASSNTQTEVQIRFWKWQSAPLQLWLVMFIAFATGILSGVFTIILKFLQSKSEIRRLRKENEKLKTDLTRSQTNSGIDSNNLASVF